VRYSKEKIISESVPLLTLCVVLEIAGGQILNNEEIFLNIPFLLIAIPVINGLFGNIGSILGARISTGLHLGIIELDTKNQELREEVYQAGILGVVMILFLTGIMWIIPSITGISSGGLDPWQFMVIMVGAGILMTIIVILMSVISAFISFKKGFDPDNTVTPVVTTTGDLMGITTLVLMVVLVI
jgi:mgtE-like transporter